MKDDIQKKIYKKLQVMSHVELAELKISGQNAVKIKHGQPVRFYGKTVERLRHLVEPK